MKKVSLSLISFLIIAIANINAQEVIAHRGYWKTDGSAQNSIAALVKADEIRVYGSNVEIWV